MKSVPLSITFFLLLAISGCQTTNVAKNDDLIDLNSVTKYCNKNYHYCIDIPSKLIKELNSKKDVFSMANESKIGGIILFKKPKDHHQRISLFIDAEPFGDGDGQLPKEIFIDGIFKNPKTDYRSLSPSDDINLQNPNSIVYIKDDEPTYTYEYWQYNDKRFVNFGVSYPKERHEELKPLLEQMSNSVVLY